MFSTVHTYIKRVFGTIIAESHKGTEAYVCKLCKVYIFSSYTLML